MSAPKSQRKSQPHVPTRIEGELALLADAYLANRLSREDAPRAYARALEARISDKLKSFGGPYYRQGFVFAREKCGDLSVFRTCLSPYMETIRNAAIAREYRHV